MIKALGTIALYEIGAMRFNDPCNREEAKFDSKSYKDGLQRAFNNAKQQVFFNPDMQFFVTLTYAGLEQDYEKVMYDIKQLCKKERRNGNLNFKYIYIFEWQKRGSLHVHMITNSALTTHINKNGHKSLTYWNHGYTSMLTVNDFDGNFKPHLYLFKYMRKSQRIGKSFVHSSRNLNNFTTVKQVDVDMKDWDIVTSELTSVKFDNREFPFYRYYLKQRNSVVSSEGNT